MIYMAKRVVNMRVLPGEPLDGTGQVCIHLFVKDESGPFTEPHALHQALDEMGNLIKQKMVARATRGRLACDPRRTVAPINSRGVITVTPRTDDPRAVTCLKCKASADYLQMMKVLTAAQAGK